MGSISGILRAKGWVSETISTLLLNYVAILLTNFFVFGPWKDMESANYPQTAEFVDAATLPSFVGTRVHAGLVFPLAALILFYFVLTRTRWGLEMRAIGVIRKRHGAAGFRSTVYYPAHVYRRWTGRVGRNGRGLCDPGPSPTQSVPGYGFIGFLISWMAGGNPLGMVAAAFLLAIVTAGGDILQMAHGFRVRR